MESSDSGVILLAPEDNCVIATRTLAAGDTVLVDGVPVPVLQPLGLGHKLARRAIAPGEKVLKYGAPIGHAAAPIARGEHIHLHNLASDWIPTWQPG
jgi:altronate dehydratase small subunit